MQASKLSTIQLILAMTRAKLYRKNQLTYEIHKYYARYISKLFVNLHLYLYTSLSLTVAYAPIVAVTVTAPSRYSAIPAAHDDRGF